MIVEVAQRTAVCFYVLSATGSFRTKSESAKNRDEGFYCPLPLPVVAAAVDDASELPTDEVCPPQLLLSAADDKVARHRRRVCKPYNARLRRIRKVICLHFPLCLRMDGWVDGWKDKGQVPGCYSDCVCRGMDVRGFLWKSILHFEDATPVIRF